MHSSRLKALTALVAILAAAPIDAAHARRTAAQEPAECTEIARALAGPRPVPLASDDLALLGDCPETGGPSLAAAWSRAGEFGVEHRVALAQASRRLADGRLYQKLRAIVEGDVDARVVRTLALQVLATYLTPALDVDPTLAEPPRRDRIVPTLLHPPEDTRPGVGLPAAAKRDIGALLGRLARTERDPVVRALALNLEQSLAYRAPNYLALAPGAVSLTAGCRPRVILASTAEVDLRVELRDVRTGRSQVHTIGAGQSGRPTRRALALPPGEVVGLLGGVEFARVTSREGPCAPNQVRW